MTACNGFTCRGTTDSKGSLVFCVFPRNTYTLREVSAPAGFVPIDHVYNICVNAHGCIFVDNALTSQIIVKNTPVPASFTAIKVNIETGMPLAGAAYTLFLNSLEIANTVSNAAGQVTFTNLSPGEYELVETMPPSGFQSNMERLPVVVAQDRSVTIMGQPSNGFILNDVPLSNFIFRKVDASTALPLAGATFELTQNSSVIATATSTTDGLVDFGVLAAETYQLMETVTPSGYQPNSTVYHVVVGKEDSITVNGIPLDEFVVEDIPIAVSAPPVINTIFEGDLAITGTGVPGSAVVVTLPNGSTVSTTVSSNGTWFVNVPNGVELVAEEVVSAVQTEPGKPPSAQVLATVVALIKPFLDKTIENLTSSGEAVEPGNVLQFTILVGNLGGVGSVWPNVVLTDFISEDLTFMPGTVAIDDELISVGTGVGQYTYDSTTRTLTIRVGDMPLVR